MFDYPFDKYKFYVNVKERTVYAISTYAGKTVRGVAKCAPEDKFDIEYGKRLAAARCNLKVAAKRVAKSEAHCKEILGMMTYIAECLSEENSYRDKVEKAFKVAMKEVNDIEMEKR